MKNIVVALATSIVISSVAGIIGIPAAHTTAHINDSLIIVDTATDEGALLTEAAEKKERRPLQESCTGGEDYSVAMLAYLRAIDDARTRAGGFESSLQQFYPQDVSGPEASVRYVIATVPDPVHTHLALSFDRALEAMSQAAQMTGHSLVRAFIPWARRASISSDSKDKKEGRKRNQTKTRSIDENESCQESDAYPGMLLFWDGGSDEGLDPRTKQALIIFLVVESPTSGIDKQQFTAALNAAGLAAGSRVRILGPRFSGSLEQLTVLMKDHSSTNTVAGWEEVQPAQQFEIRSGTVTSNEAIAAFVNSAPKSKIFSIFQYTDCDMLKALLTFTGATPGQIAVISEGETSYGRGACNLDGKTGSETNRAEQEKKNVKRETQRNVPLALSFPRGISNLRAAYQSNRQESDDHQQIPHAALPMNFEDPGGERDELPIFAPKQTPLSQDAIMMRLATALRVHHPRYVVLRATDPLDMVFLAGYVHDAYPAGRIVTLGAEQLLARGDDARFTGMLSLTTYPLLPRWLNELTPISPTWQKGADADAEDKARTADWHWEHVLPDSDSVGVVNAGVALFEHSKPSNRLGDGGKLDLPSSSHYVEYSPPAFETPTHSTVLVPNIWLTIIGRDGYWPVSTQEYSSISGTGNNDKDATRPTQQGKAPNSLTADSLSLAPSTDTLVLLLLFSTIALVFTYEIWYGRLSSNRVLEQELAPDLDRSRSLLIAALAFGAFADLCLFALPIVTRPGAFSSWFIIPAAIAVFVAGAAALNVWKVRRRPILAIVLVLICIAWLFVLTRLMEPFASGWRVSNWQSLMLYRSMHLFSGVNPVAPLHFYFAALIVWIWALLRIRSLFGERSPVLPSGVTCSREQCTVGAPLLPAGDVIDTHQLSHLVPFDATFCFRFLLPICVLGYAVFRWGGRVRSVESSALDTLYHVMFVGGLILLSHTVYSGCNAWGYCRKLLSHLENSPIKDVFKRLDGFAWTSLWAMGAGGNKQVHKPQIRALETLANLQVLNANKPGAASLMALAGEVQLDAMHFRERHGDITGSPAELAYKHSNLLFCLHKVQLQLAATCTYTWCVILTPYYGTRTVPKPEIVKTAEEFVALTYVNAVIRLLLYVRDATIAAGSIFILLIFASILYPFQPQATIRVFFVVLFFAIGAVVMMVFAQMYRDPVLANLTNTSKDSKGGKLGLEFWAHVATYGLIPLLTLLATQVPAVARWLFFWRPALQVLR